MHLQAPRLAFRRVVRPAGGTVVVVETTLDYYYHNLQKDLSLPPRFAATRFCFRLLESEGKICKNLYFRNTNKKVAPLPSI